MLNRVSAIQTDENRTTHEQYNQTMSFVNVFKFEIHYSRQQTLSFRTLFFSFQSQVHIFTNRQKRIMSDDIFQ